MTPQEFLQKMSLPYEAKVNHAYNMAWEFYNRLGGDVYCSVGGFDSITLLTFLRKHVSSSIPGASVSCLEDKSITKVHRTFDNFRFLKPLKNKAQVIHECGYPVISKDYALAIKMLQNPTKYNEKSRNRKMTGICQRRNGETYFSPRTLLPKRWKELFAGLENSRYGTNYRIASFMVSPDCCYWMKEKPCHDYESETKLKPYLGLMASEHGRREETLRGTGCNYYGKRRIRSAPFAIFSRQDLLQLALDLNVPVPAVYGAIERKADGTLYTTKAQRTGCSMCGFGIHLEQRPHRFDRLRQANYREWKFWMYDMGWGKVLDYIGVKWENEFMTYEQGKLFNAG